MASEPVYTIRYDDPSLSEKEQDELQALDRMMRRAPFGRGKGKASLADAHKPHQGTAVEVVQDVEDERERAMVYLPCARVVDPAQIKQWDGAFEDEAYHPGKNTGRVL